MHCPHCGKPVPEGSIVCPACSAALVPPGGAVPWGAMKPSSRTMVGVALPDALRQPPAASSRTMVGVALPDALRQAPASRTMVGMALPAEVRHLSAPEVGQPPAPADLHGAGQGLHGGAGQGRAAPRALAPQSGHDAGSRTLVGMPVANLAVTQPLDPRLAGGTLLAGTPAAAGARLEAPRGPDGAAGQAPPFAQGAAQAPGMAPPFSPSRTLLGVARPGIAPLAPGVAPEPEPEPGASYEPAAELGATVAPVHFRPPKRNHVLVRPPRVMKPPKRPAPPPRTSRRAIAVVAAGGVLALGAVLFALLWPSAPPVTARARADAGGREVIELRCASCPDGTVVSIGEGRATIAGGVAQIPLASPLSVGENRMKVAIDRPGRERDETVGVSIHVAYRIRPDLGTLQGERPSLQIVVEASKGTQVTLDGKEVALANGRAIHAIDVSEAITGPSDEPKTLSRQVPYVVTPPDGPREQGMVSVAVGIVPLFIEAPGPSVVIDKESFVLAGRTARGAQIFAGAHPIAVRPDGTFAHVMNVSSVGATQFEVRAKLQGMAPRIAKIAVRRVDRLETAAKEFAERAPLGYAQISAGAGAHVGKPIVVSGEVVETRRQGHATLMLLSVPRASGCSAKDAAAADPGAAQIAACKVRLLHGADNPAQRGDVLTAYGTVAPPFVAPGGAEIPEVQVEFTMKGAR